jgi:hypothetical protein
VCNLGIRSLSSCVEVVIFRSTQESRTSGQVGRKDNAARCVSLAVEIRVGCVKFHAALSRDFGATAAKSGKLKFLIKYGMRNLKDEN